MAGKKRLPRGRLHSIISDVKERHGLSEDCVITKDCIISRMQRQKLHISRACPGPSSPLEQYELEFVAILIQMARMRECLSPSEAVALINSLISGKQAQQDLIEWKKKNTYGETGSVGVGY